MSVTEMCTCVFWFVWNFIYRFTSALRSWAGHMQSPQVQLEYTRRKMRLEMMRQRILVQRKLRPVQPFGHRSLPRLVSQLSEWTTQLHIAHSKQTSMQTERTTQPNVTHLIITSGGVIHKHWSSSTVILYISTQDFCVAMCYSGNCLSKADWILKLEKAWNRQNFNIKCA